MILPSTILSMVKLVTEANQGRVKPKPILARAHKFSPFSLGFAPTSCQLQVFGTSFGWLTRFLPVPFMIYRHSDYVTLVSVLRHSLKKTTLHWRCSIFSSQLCFTVHKHQKEILVLDLYSTQPSSNEASFPSCHQRVEEDHNGSGRVATQKWLRTCILKFGAFRCRHLKWPNSALSEELEPRRLICFKFFISILLVS